MPATIIDVDFGFGEMEIFTEQRGEWNLILNTGFATVFEGWGGEAGINVQIMTTQAGTTEWVVTYSCVDSPIFVYRKTYQGFDESPAMAELEQTLSWLMRGGGRGDWEPSLIEVPQSIRDFITEADDAQYEAWAAHWRIRPE